MQNNFLSLTSSSPLGRLRRASKHIPDIPSAEEMETSGVNLTEMNKLLLQKVEELSLYLIDKNKHLED